LETNSEAWFLSLIAARTLVVLLVLLAGIRLTGKRQVGGMNLFDLVLVLALANAVQNAMTNGSGDLGVGLVAAGMLFLADRALGILFTRMPSLEGRLAGVPTVIVQNGHLERGNMRREGITEDEVLAAVRSYGLANLSEVKLAILEEDGSLSVVAKS
jgi:uncharacterized membrane protein YcaP (DUF421 family)